MYEFIINFVKTTIGLSDTSRKQQYITPTADALALIDWLVETTGYKPIDLVFPVNGKGWCIPSKHIGYAGYGTGKNGHVKRVGLARILEVTDASLAIQIKLKFGFIEVAEIVANKGVMPR